jgi:hypothetical protein
MPKGDFPLKLNKYTGLILGLVILGGALVLLICFRHTDDLGTSLKTLTCASTELKETVVLPTLDTPIPTGKSAIWCAAFDLAWKELEKNIFREPIKPKNGTPTAERLTASSSSADDFIPESLYVTSGQTPDVVNRLKNDFPSRFPNVTIPTINAADDTLTAFAFLSANVPFKIPFFDNDQPLDFEDAQGNKTPVVSFGIREKDHDAYEQLRKQVKVLFRYEAGENDSFEEFAIDPCSTSEPYQLVLAVIKPQKTLSEAVKYVQNYKQTLVWDFGFSDTLLIPNQYWEISHRFLELIGPVSNPGFEDMSILDAAEIIRFRLDRSGAKLSAEAQIPCKSAASYYMFNRPFLVYIQKRGTNRPIFAAWIAGAELLQKKK